MRVLLAGSGTTFPLGTELACRLAGCPEVSHLAVWSVAKPREPERLREAGVEILWDFPEFSGPGPVVSARKLNHSRQALRRFKDRGFDVVSVQYLDAKLASIVGPLSRVGSRFTTTLWGTDLLGSNALERWCQKQVLSRCDAVSAASPDLLERTQAAYGDWIRPRLHEVRFGLTTLESMCREGWTRAAAREELGLPLEGPIIALGYHAGVLNRHFEVLKQLEEATLPANATIVLPITYGGTAARRASICEAAERSPLRCVVFQEFMSSRRVAALRTAVDVLIHVPVSDAFSGSMTEHLYAGNRVITGKWLPFDWLSEHGITLDRIDRFEDTGAAVERVVSELDSDPSELEAMREAIWALASWESNLPSWLRMLRG